MSIENEPVISCLAPSFLPASAVLEMTYRCNHECLFCSCPWYSPMNNYNTRRELSVNEWKIAIRQLCEMGVSSLAFTGGEPLLKKGILEIISYAANCKTIHIETVEGSLAREEKPPNLHLLSNGKIVNKDVLRFCRDYSVHLGMSLPGLSTFKSHTKKSEVYEIVHKFAETRSSGISTHVGITVTKKNVHELYETIAESLLAGADTVLLNRFMPGGRGLLYANDLMLSKDDITAMLDIAEELLRMSDRRGNIGTEIPLCLFDEKKYKHLRVGTQCSAAIDFFAVDPSGYIRVCNHSPVRIGHINEIEKAKDSDYWRRFAIKDYLPEQCFRCKAMGRCDGGCREAAHIWRGCIDSPDPLLDDSGNSDNCKLPK